MGTEQATRVELWRCPECGLTWADYNHDGFKPYDEEPPPHFCECEAKMKPFPVISVEELQAWAREQAGLALAEVNEHRKSMNGDEFRIARFDGAYVAFNAVLDFIGKNDPAPSEEA